MSLCSTLPSVDHHLVARAEARATGANAHELHSLIASYHGFTEMAATMPECGWRVEVIEQRLRAFCRTGELTRGETCVTPAQAA